MKSLSSRIIALALAAGVLSPLSVAAEENHAFYCFSTQPSQITRKSSSVDTAGSTLNFSTRSNETRGYYDSGLAFNEMTRTSLYTSGSLEVRDQEENGYRFKGWYTKDGDWISPARPSIDDTNVLITASATISGDQIFRQAAKLNDNCVVIARLVPLYTISTAVVPTGRGTATGSHDDGKYEEGDPVTLTASPAAGYSFSEWRFDGESVSESASYKFVAAAETKGEYTAVFAPKTYAVTLDKQGGTDGLDSINAVFDTLMPDVSPLPKKTGHSFGGYWEKANGEGKCYVDETGRGVAVWDKAGETRIYAKWIANPYDMTLTLNPGVAKICYRVLPDEEWSEVAASSAIPVDFGKTVKLYAVAEPDFRVDDSYTKSNPLTKAMSEDGLEYAPTASRDGFTLTVDPNGGEYQGNRQPIALELHLKRGTTNLNEIGIATLSDQVLEGYYCDNQRVYDAQGHNVACDYWYGAYPGGTFNGSADMTVVARWTDVTYDVTFHDPTATFADRTVKVAKGRAATPPTWEVKGLSLAWDRDFSHVTESMTVNAVWTPITYAVRFDANGGSGEMEDVTDVRWGEEIALPANRFENGILPFSHWTTTVDGVRREFSDGATVSNLVSTADGTNTLYAVWGSEYQVVFDGNGATGGGMEPQKIKVGESVNLTSNAYVRTGYRFVQWHDRDRPEIRYEDGASVRNLAESGQTKTLVAEWEANAYTVAFVGNGGTGEMADLALIYDRPQNLTSNAFARSGFTFAGWATDPAEPPQFDDGAEVTNLTAAANGRVSLYAMWKGDEAFKGPYSVAADCDRTDDAGIALAMTADVAGWCTVEEGEDKGGNGQFVKLMPTENATVELTTSLVGKGTLSFWYKAKFKYGDGENNLLVSSDSAQEIRKVIQSASEWTQVTWAKTTDDKETVKWIFTAAYPEDGDWAYVDCIKWNPEVREPMSVGVTLRLNDGTPAPLDIVTNLTRNAGEAIGELPVPVSASGRAFLGWRTAKGEPVDEAWPVPAEEAGVALLASWEGGAPEPTEKDRVTIGAVRLVDGAFALSFEANALFGYELWRNEDLADEAGWEQVKDPPTSTKDSVITFTPAVDPAKPRLFYRVRTVRKANP